MVKVEDVDSVLVTGAEGFVAGHLIADLLRNGYKVHGTVQNLQNVYENFPHLLQLVPHQRRSQLELFEADLLKDGSFDDAIEGCSWVAHLASPISLDAEDGYNRLIKPAVEGTRNVLESCARYSIKRVVLISSFYSTCNFPDPDNTISEEDWNAEASATNNPYAASKTQAEKFAWEFVDRLPEEDRFRLVCINPSLIIGEVLKRKTDQPFTKVSASVDLVLDMMLNKFLLCPQFSLPLVSVEDVVTALRAGLEKEKVSGRYIIHADDLYMGEIATICKKLYPDYGVRDWVLPGWMTYLLIPFDKRLTFHLVKRQLKLKYSVDTSKSREELGIEYKPLDEAIFQTIDSCFDLGHLPLKGKMKPVAQI